MTATRLPSLEERLQHSTFPQPEDPSVKVWRYMDLPKFIWLLSERKLALPRVDTLTDPHEGSLTTRTIEWIERFIQSHGAKTSWSELSQSFRNTLHQTYVSCWHANVHESEAMWRLYCGSHDGIAIQTTYAQLAESIRPHGEAHIGCVKYMNYEKDFIREANMYAPVMHKRISFSHESEIRIVVSPNELRGRPKEEMPTILTLDWVCEEHAMKIHVSPYAPEYFFAAVQSTLRALSPSLESKLVWSFMKAAPVF